MARWRVFAIINTYVTEWRGDTSARVNEIACVMKVQEKQNG